MPATGTASTGLGRATLAVAACAIAAFAAACADRPTNDQADLNRYGAATTTAAPPAGGATSRVVRQDTATRQERPARRLAAARQASAARERAAAVLTGPDVRGEGVSPATERPPLDTCLARALGAANVAPASAWRYPTGATLVQYVVPVAEPGTALSGPAQRCGRPVEVSEQAGVQQQAAWCGPGCGVALAGRQQVSVLEVRGASSDARAAAAVRRLAPAAARRLAG